MQRPLTLRRSLVLLRRWRKNLDPPPVYILMTVAVKNDNKTPLVVPSAARRKAGFKSGQELEVRASGGVITIVPKLPSAADEYTPAARRAIDARLKKALSEVAQSQTAGPFPNAEEMITSLKSRMKESDAKPAKKRAR